MKDATMLPVRAALFCSASVLSLLACEGAHAVYVNPENKGQALIYPYYTVRNGRNNNGYFSVFTIENPTSAFEAIRVRVREGRRGQTVGQFNLFLSSARTWSAALISTSDGTKLVTADNSCTWPSSVRSSGLVLGNSQYAGDGGGDSLDRTREGWIEVISMGNIKDGALKDTINGSSPSCQSGVLQTVDGSNGSAYLDGQSGQGHLSGISSLVNVYNGTAYSYGATALDDFSDTILFASASNTSSPSLRDVNPKVATIIDNRERTGHYSFQQLDIDPVSAVLMAYQISSNFSVEAATASGTDWVITMPTKPYLSGYSAAATRMPFQNAWNNGASCDDLGYTMLSRDAGRESSGSLSLCNALNVLAVGNNAKVLGSSLGQSVSIASQPEAGRLILTFSPLNGNNYAHMLYSDNSTLEGWSTHPSTIFYGLPVLGFAVNDAANGTLSVNGQAILSNYGYTYPQRSNRSLQTAAQ